jgi:nucleolar protein 53
VVPAVEVADPGASYNPDAEQHQDLIGEALVQEKRRLSTERRMKHMTWNQQRVLRGKDPTEMLAAQEVGEGEEGVALLEDAGDGKTSAAAGDEDEEDGSRAVQNNKMTRAQRNKQARVREQERQLRERRQAKRRRQQENRVEAIVGEVKHISAEREAKAAKREEQVGDDGHTPARAGALPAAQWSFCGPESSVHCGAWTKNCMCWWQRARRAVEPQRLGPQKYQEKVLAVDLPLTEELQGSMRSAKVKGSLLHDRMQSFEKRNLLEPRKAVAKRRRYRLKSYITKNGKLDGRPDGIA